MSTSTRIRNAVLLLASLSWPPTIVLPAQEPDEGEPAKAEKILFRDYRPVSMYKIPRTKVTKARCSAIDVHGHDYAKTEEDVTNWVKTMDMALNAGVGRQKAWRLTPLNATHVTK